MQRAAREAVGRRAGAAHVVGARPGIYVEFESFPGLDLAIKSFEHVRPSDPHRRVEVVAARTVVIPATALVPEAHVQYATVFVPDGEVARFVGRFERYAGTAPDGPGGRRHHDFVDRISSLRLGSLQALWTDDLAAFPTDDQWVWWEVWLRKTDGQELRRFSDYAGQANVKLGRRTLAFDDRIVLLAYASPRALASAIDILDDVAELRRAKELATFFVNESPASQGDWVRDLRKRTGGPSAGAASVAVLDSGVTQGHPLLELALDPRDVHAIDPDWGGHDDGGATQGHGTEMSGLALYGDLAPLLGGTDRVDLRHRLESVKILPTRRLAPHAPDNYGAVTAMAVSYPEISAPERARVFSMAVTASDQRDRGQPTAWSAAIDALCIGRSFDATPEGITFTGTSPSRLFVISAGNNTTLERAHLDRSDLEPVEDPAQAWNALTVGACTERAVITDAQFDEWTPLAPTGELSPHSTTSVGFAAPWPVKPDVVMEGGNIGISASDAIHDDIPDLLPLTTYYKPHVKAVVTSCGTSAACAAAARLCAWVMTEYPLLWPETVRGLVVHAARWTNAMSGHLRPGADTKAARARLLRRYGYGIPDEGRLLRSANDALTLIAEASIRPFDDGGFGDLHVHRLPWPDGVLASLGETEVQLRVTLSYFIEPNPARRGWQARHRYQSHALRFEVKRPFEEIEDFRKRINQRALSEGERRPEATGDEGWFFGPRAREHGSVHSDYWTGTAADLAERGVIGVHPVTGWWKEQKKRDRSAAGVRYALIVSIDTPGVASDIWTPVAQQIGVPVEIVV